MKKEMLKNMKMPEKKKDPMLSFDESDMEGMNAPSSAPAEGSPEEESMESPAEEKTEVSQELKDAQDQDLIEELKRRGYDVQHDEAGNTASSGPEEMDMGQ